MSKTFTYQIDGLAYTVTVYEQNGEFFADITVDEGAMDVNAFYFGDDDQSGSSASLGGPLNMNGASLGGEKVQWDEATYISDPGLGPDGEDKQSYLQEGDTLTLSLDISSLDEIDIVGVRATSTTNDAGSIKGVSDDPVVPEEPEDPVYSKIFFGETFDEQGNPTGGTFILDEEPDPNTFNIPFLPEGTDPTFENYLSYFENDLGGDVTTLDAIVFYEQDEEGGINETFRIEAPEGGFTDAEEVLVAYDDALTELENAGEFPGEDLIAALSTGEEPEVIEQEDPPVEDGFADVV